MQRSRTDCHFEISPFVFPSEPPLLHHHPAVLSIQASRLRLEIELLRYNWAHGHHHQLTPALPAPSKKSHRRFEIGTLTSRGIQTTKMAHNGPTSVLRAFYQTQANAKELLIKDTKRNMHRSRYQVASYCCSSLHFVVQHGTG